MRLLADTLEAAGYLIFGVLDGDQIMAMCAQDLMDRSELVNNTLVATVMSNFGFLAALRELSIGHDAAQVGDRYVLEMLRETGGLLGGEFNAVAGRKRPLSSMTPTIVESPDGGRPLLVLGSPGGSTIITTVLQVIVNVVDHGLSAQAAVDAGRIHHQWLPDVTFMEEWEFSPDTRRLYEMFGHQVQEIDSQGRTMAIYVDRETGLLYAPGDIDQLTECTLRLAGSSELRQAFGTAAAQRARELFNESVQMQRILQQIEASANPGKGHQE